VQVRQAKLRSGPAAWSTSVGTLSYGDPLTVIGGDDPWWQVKTSKGKTGYIPTSSVSDRKIILSSVGYSGSARVDQSDVVLAGKGFSKEVEKSFASSSGLDYRKVDQVEKNKVSDSDINAFIKAGELKGGR
jgi:uncharacterized protein YgiM (DUF1202 family)